MSKKTPTSFVACERELRRRHPGCAVFVLFKRDTGGYGTRRTYVQLYVGNAESGTIWDGATFAEAWHKYEKARLPAVVERVPGVARDVVDAVEAEDSLHVDA